MSPRALRVPPRRSGPGRNNHRAPHLQARDPDHVQRDPCGWRGKTHISIDRSAYLIIHPSAYLSICLSIHLSIYLPAHLCFYLWTVYSTHVHTHIAHKHVKYTGRGPKHIDTEQAALCKSICSAYLTGSTNRDRQKQRQREGGCLERSNHACLEH